MGVLRAYQIIKMMQFAPPPAADAVPVLDHFLRCWLSHEANKSRGEDGGLDVCYITVRRCAIEIVESATGDRVMHRLPGHGDPKCSCTTVLEYGRANICCS